MELETLLYFQWKNYTTIIFGKINELLGINAMSYGRLVRKIIYFHTCIMSYDKIDKYVYFVKPPLINKYWKIMEDDLTFEQNVDADILENIRLMMIEQVNTFRTSIKRQEKTISACTVRKSVTSLAVKLSLYRGSRIVAQYELNKERYDCLYALCNKDCNVDENIVKIMLRYDFYGRNKEGVDLSVDKIYSYLIENTKELNILEAFAGAINCNAINYCSLFYDIEKMFGSKGSFFLLDNLTEYDMIIANPPYITSIMNNMALKLIEYLGVKDNDAYCVVIIPDWRTDKEVEDYPTIMINEGDEYERSKIEYEVYTLLRKSSYHKKTLVVAGMKYASFFNEPHRKIRSNSLILILSNNDEIPEYLNNIHSII